MSKVRTAIAAAIALVAVSVSAACGASKDPMVPDNPSSDPLMLDAGGPVPGEGPAPAASAAK